MGNIHIVSIADNNYIPHFGALLCSIFENKIGSYFIHIYLITLDISVENKKKLKKLEDTYHFTIHYLQVDKTKYEPLVVRGYWNHTTYYKLSIPNIIDTSIEKILYLDSDMIVRSDLQELWKTDLGDYAVGCVEDIGTGNPKVNQEPKYFNAGMMLINLKKWRKEKVGEKAFNFIKNNPKIIRYLDQDGLNHVLQKDVKYISGKYNVMNIRRGIHKIGWTSKEQKNPSIIHFTPGRKPWMGFCVHQLRYWYYHYIGLTPWKLSKQKVFLLRMSNFLYILPSFFYIKIRRIKFCILIEKSIQKVRKG